LYFKLGTFSIFFYSGIESTFELSILSKQIKSIVMTHFNQLMIASGLAFMLWGCNSQSGEKANLQQQSNKTTALMYVTARDSNLRLTLTDTLKVSDVAQTEENASTIFVDPSKQFQSLIGIGGAFTDAAAETFYKLPGSVQKEILTAYFDSTNGIGYTLGRTHINSCDFSSHMYTYADSADKELKSFNIEPDRKFRIPFIKASLQKAGRPITLFVSPWSPPSWMKSNHNMLHGGKLLPEYASTWALYFAKFIKAYESEGIPVWGLTVQNEPMAVQTWESCTYTVEEERDFIKKDLGPTLQKEGLSAKKVIVWDHNRGMLYQRVKAIYDDPEASKYVWGAGFHWYVGDHFENVGQVHDAYPDKHLIFTEGCNYPFEFSKINDWNWGENYGRSLINDLNNYTEAWTDWNMILDETGGPNHVNNFCYAPIIADTRTGEIHYMNSFYYIGHFSKFIRPGAKRIACTSSDDKLIATSFVNPDGKIATVVMNQSDVAVNFNVWIAGKLVSSTLPAHAITTVVY
jgi:glucosylceramidase